MIDYHVHLWPHDERADSAELRLERLARYCERAAIEGVAEIALTEHLFRFVQVRDLAREFWEGDEEALSRSTREYFEFHATADLDRYVEEVLAAKRAGLPVLLGLEVDYYRGAMGRVAETLRAYPFDVLLGSVHWIGAWMFDNIDDGAVMAEWDRRGTDEAWCAYAESFEELAATRTCDVLAHPDLVKLCGRIADPGIVVELHRRMAEAARASGMAAEISSAGYRKPVGEAYPSPALLRRFYEAGVPVTTASDAHGNQRVGERNAELCAMARSAGYVELRGFRGREPYVVPLPAVEAVER